MAKYVPDSKTQRWVIIAPSRSARPDQAGEVKPKEKICPFCPGNEAVSPTEVYRLGPGEKNAPGWKVRVVENKYPITDIHEVIIHSPDETQDLAELPLDQVTSVVTCYRDRFRAHEHDGQVLIFCNHGFHAGASLAHPHSQLVVVPKQINLDAVSREPIANVVETNTFFLTYCPDFSQWPYEVWIAPKVEHAYFGDLNETELADLAGVLQRALQGVRRVYDDKHNQHIQHDMPFGYNYYIHHGANWFLRIIPRFVHRAGFELGTGLSVNIVDPAEAAEHLTKK